MGISVILNYSKSLYDYDFLIQNKIATFNKGVIDNNARYMVYFLVKVNGIVQCAARGMISSMGKNVLLGASIYDEKFIVNDMEYCTPFNIEILRPYTSNLYKYVSKSKVIKFQKSIDVLNNEFDSKVINSPYIFSNNIQKFNSKNNNGGMPMTNDQNDTNALINIKQQSIGPIQLDDEIYKNKIKNIIKNLGPTNLNVLSTWIPQLDKYYIEKLVLNCDSLLISDNNVSLKETIQEEAKQKQIKNDDELTYEKLLNIIDNYNKKIKEEFEYKCNSEEFKFDAIKKSLEEKYSLEHFETGELFVIYKAIRKSNGNKSYIVICKDYNNNVFSKLSSLPAETEVLVFYTNIKDESIPETEDIYIQDGKNKISDVSKNYILEEANIIIYKLKTN